MQENYRLKPGNDEPALLLQLTSVTRPLQLIPLLHDPIKCYKITHAGRQVAQWDFQNNAPAFVLEVPLRNLLTSMCDFVPCDRLVQRAY